VYKSLESETQF